MNRFPAKECTGRPPDKHNSVVVTDTLLEGVHFESNENLKRIGRKALAVNLSDIAAMGASASTAFVNLVLPKVNGFHTGLEIMKGITDLASEFGVTIAGGDTNSWDGPLVVSVTVVGQSHKKGPVLRSGARGGDVVFITGELGGSISGHHLDFVPRLTEANWLMENFEVNAMIDVSDGLGQDFSHICTQSQIKGVLYPERIPLRPPLTHPTGVANALSDGEDFELLFTVSEEQSRLLLQQASELVKITCIGKCEVGEGVFLRNAYGSEKKWGGKGFEHGLS